MHFVGVIPARFNSSRFPGKPLVEIAGRPLIQWVYSRVSRTQLIDQVLVATDDERIASTVRGFGGEVRITDPDHASGTDRVAEVAKDLSADVILNIQGDEPTISEKTIEGLCRPFSDPAVEVATARFEITGSPEVENPNINKVVTRDDGRALYFSRSVIPFPRGRGGRHYKHIGIYAYRRDFLLRLPELKPSMLEEAEALEQLRFLENGIEILVVDAVEDSLGVDTPEDVERVRPLLENFDDQPLKLWLEE